MADGATTAPIPSASIGANLTVTDLQAFLGKSVKDFCGKYGDVGDDQLTGEHHKNHCAHFVAHVLQLRIPGAALCSNVNDSTYKYEERMLGFCIRVNQVFNSLKGRARVDIKSPPTTPCLIVATVPANMEDEKTLTIGSHKLKHIGFLIDGKVYNYSNANSEVIATELEHFASHYGAQTILLRADFP